MIFVGMAAVGLFGWLTTVALAFIESQVLAWHPSVRELVSA
jgi:ABC-type nitrate/sulfonate/bicarbonate transport system permease component